MGAEVRPAVVEVQLGIHSNCGNDLPGDGHGTGSLIALSQLKCVLQVGSASRVSPRKSKLELVERSPWHRHPRRPLAARQAGNNASDHSTLGVARCLLR
jgi:hypothetical protein